MANTVDKVLKVAENEVGYLEKSAAAYRKNPKVLDKKIEGAGSDNYTKYGRDMHRIYPKIMDFPAYWCDAFVDWLFYTAYGISTAKSLLGGDFNDYTVASAQMYKNKNALDTKPTKGAQVFFTKNGQVSGCHHTGLVYAVDNTYFYTIEGNTSGGSGVVRNGGGVAKKKYNIAAYKGKVLFGHPKYDVEKKEESKPATSSKDKNPYKQPTLIKAGSSGEGVKWLQWELNQSGYKLTIDGEAGTKTITALRQFQKKYNLTVDGIAGDKTIEILKKKK